MRKSARTQIYPFFDNDPYTCTVRSIRTGSFLLLMFRVLSCVRCDA